MFACAPYPENNEDFVQNASAEIQYQVTRLRNHPSMALWSGNNEIQMMFQMLTSSIPGVPPLSGLLYFDEIMPRLVQEHDGHTPYWPSSPFGDGMREGDYHDWHVWHGIPLLPDESSTETPAGGFDLFLSMEKPTPEAVSFVRYAEDRARFISEFGMHASPTAETLRRVIPEDQLYHHSPAIDHHNKDNPKNKGDLLMSSVTGLPQNLEEYIDFSMIAQAEGLKFGIEHFRRRKPHCSGSLIWQLNDCWPGLSWSILDYYGFGKASYYYVRRAYAPVLASFKELTDGSIELWLTNDTQRELNDTVVIQYGSYPGQWKPASLAVGHRARRGCCQALSSCAFPARAVSHQPPLLHSHQGPGAFSRSPGVSHDLTGGPRNPGSPACICVCFLCPFCYCRRASAF
jgi:beta-mannosidase